MCKICHILYFVTLIFALSHAKDEEYCKKYNGNPDDFIDCCITLFPALDDEEKSDEVKYNICESNTNKCEEYTCVMETDNQLLPDGKIDKSAVISKIMEDKDSAVWQAVIEHIYTKCAKAAETSTCAPMTFSICFESTTFIECPQSEWNNTASCNEAKRYVQNCILKT